jgi:trk system potassium uptake protein TrkA
MVIPRGAEALQVGDRIIVIGSPQAAREWSELMSLDRKRVDDVVIFGAGRIGVSVARMLLGQQVRVRLIEADGNRARTVADKLPTARVFHATGIDPDFLERERIGHARAAIFAMRDDAKNHYASTLAKLHGVDFTIAVVHEQISEQVFESAGVDVVVNPRQVTAEELVRFAHDPRTLQVAMLERDKYEVLDVRVRAESEYANRRFGDMPATGALIGAIVRNGDAIFPHRDDVLRPGDRVIVFSESSRVAWVEKTL